MDFRNFRNLAKALPAVDNSTNSSQPLTPNILEALVPGYGIISNYAASAFGIDISIFVTIGIILVAGTKAGQFIFEQAETLFRNVFMSSVYVDDHDDLFDMIMGWLAENQSSHSRRAVRAKTQKGSQLEGDLDDDEALDEDGLFDYNKWNARMPPRFEPYYGRHFLWHKGRMFFFRRSQRQSAGRVQVQFGGTPEEDLIQIDCVGRSTVPIRELLRTIKTWSLDRLRNTTTIRHPTPKDRARYGGAWSRTASRPSRPMETVILDADQKRAIIMDMNEYLHPSSPKWYATRGIPYRRGYLFHGPPGTGKTSLSFALAGIFGLEIYAISLQEPTLTEGDLMQLFNSLPRRCIVLLEDVDAAGLLRDSKSDKNKEKKEKDVKDGKDGAANDGEKGDQSKTKKDEEYTLKDLAKELKSISAPKRGNRGMNNAPGGHPNREPGTGISLSGLLNAIDGVATHEGRVLIMTTNHPEKLDAALVRPGRVDRRVGFSLAKRAQISELFVRMYAASDQVPSSDPRLHQHVNANGQSNGHNHVQANGKPKSNGHAAAGENQLVGLSEADIEELSIEFAGQVPDDTFTPAEIQNHLMRYKKEPRTAVDKADQWGRELLAEKKEVAESKRKAEEEEEAEED